MTFELSILVLHFLYSLFFFLYTSVSYFNFLCLLLRHLEAHSNFNSTPCVTAISYIVQSKLCSLLWNCWFVDWGLTSSLKEMSLWGRLSCRATVWQCYIFYFMLFVRWVGWDYTEMTRKDIHRFILNLSSYPWMRWSWTLVMHYIKQNRPA